MSSYSQTDLISINGVSLNSKIVNLSIINQNNELVWAEQVSVKNNGKYSTLAIAGGSGWENSGTYTIKVDDGSEIKSDNFFIYFIIFQILSNVNLLTSLSFSTVISSIYSR